MTREEIISLSRTKDEFKIPFSDFQKVDFMIKKDYPRFPVEIT